MPGQQTGEFQGSKFSIEDSANPGTFIELGQVLDCSFSGGDTPLIDKSHHQSTRREYRLGLPDEGEVTFSINYKPADAGAVEFAAMRAARQQTKFEIEYNFGFDASEPKDEFDGLVQSFTKTGSVDNIWTAEFGVKITGEITHTPGSDV